MAAYLKLKHVKSTSKVMETRSPNFFHFIQRVGKMRHQLKTSQHNPTIADINSLTGSLLDINKS